MILSKTEFLIFLQQVYGDEDCDGTSIIQGHCLVLGEFITKSFHHGCCTFNEKLHDNKGVEES